MVFSTIGLLGTIPFLCSSEVVHTFKDLSITRSGRWATHDIIGKKPVLEYIGPGLTEISFSIQLSSFLGAPPLAALKLLESMLEKRQPQRFLVGPEYLGKFVIESMSEDRRHHNNRGICVYAVVNITLKEVA